MGNQHRLSQAQKTAIVIIALGEEHGAKFLQKLDRQDALRVMAELTRMERIDAELANAVLAEFSENVSKARRQRLEGGPELAQSLVQRAFTGEFGKDLALQLKAVSSVKMKSLEGVDGETLAAIIEDEHPQTISIILVHAEPAQAAAALSSLPSRLHTDILVRIASLETVAPDIIEDLDHHLAEEIRRRGIQGGSKLGGAEKAAQILAALGQQSGEDIWNQLDERSPDLAATIRGLMFTFHDIVKISMNDMVHVHRVVGDQWKIALRGAPEPIKEHVFQSMSERAAQILRDDLENGQKVRASDVQAAQQAIIDRIKALDDAGQIQILSSDDVYV